MPITFQQSAKQLQRLADVVSRNRSKYQTIASNEVKSLLSKRIHNRGLNTDGRKIGSYSAAYAKARKTGLNIGGRIYKGLQTAYVDLQVTGDLFRSEITGRSGKNIVVGIAGNLQVEKAGKMEEKYGEVFKPSKSETRAAEIKFMRELDEDVKKALK